MNRSHLCAGSALTFVMAVGSSQAFAAAAAPAATGPANVSEVVVTGSLISGTPKTAALPVDVVTQDMLKKQGAPTVIEVIKQLPESSGVIGESNQFVAGGRGQGQYGTSTVNLRGLGPERTLTLFNGHRLPLAFAIAPDPNMLPLAAIGRVEVLKDGAAATYGSDAIGGVVNFITRRSFEGLEIGGDYRWIDGSKGNDYTANLTWGKVGDNWDVLVSGGYQHRSELPVLGKDWAHKIYDLNPEGGWTGGGNPEAFTPSTATGIPIAGGRVDLGCAALGGQLTTKNANAAPLLPWTSCRGQYSIWDNLEEEENRYQAFAQFNWKFAEHHELHLDAAYGYTDLPFFKSSPSYVTTRPVPLAVMPAGFATIPALTVGGPPVSSLAYFVPVTNPGFAAYIAANPGQFPAGAAGALMTIGTFRPYLTGGNPLYNYEHGVGGPYWHDQILFDAGVKGDVTSNTTYDVNFSYGRYKSYGEGRDSLTDRLELALRGLGGPNCNFKTGTPGVGGCQYLNPFSNGIPGAPNRGLTNPGFVSSLANTAALADWIMPIQSATTNFQEYEFNAVLSGKIPWWTLPGGDIKWAAGFQWRHNSYVTNYSQFGNEIISPCSNSVPPVGTNDCIFPSNPNPAVTTGTGPNVFGPVSIPVDISQDIYAGFGELNVPITSALNLELAGRYEDYGSNGGDTFNPQARLRWQANEWLAFRGSVGTTFRAPPQGSLIPNPTTNLQQVLGTFIPVSTIGNPKLEPETALVYSVGSIVQNGGLRATIDYWNYDFKKVLTSEPLTPVINAVFPNGASGANNCNNPALAGFIAAHLVFNGPCGPGVVAVNLQAINGPDVKTDGLDFDLTYDWTEVFGGDLIASALFTHVNKYQVGALQIGTVTIPAFQAAGFFNSGQIAYPIPRWKGTFALNYAHGPFNVHYQLRYIDHYVDQRTALFTFNPIYVTPTNPSGIVTAGQKIKAQILHDVTLLWDAPYGTKVTLGINNVFDKAPPFARTDINYDALTGDPLGRTVKLGLEKTF
ncbi:TonB-dependent receptor domain-containing protein [Phenylobacterium sp.]|jgi:iron complex outermembrane receptor protein|uniref:TonB-dependent receptor domain-containing protein n=1 Tax=Phenylobacterium sp. TaxID=1871053 RepID=UPI002F40A3B7